MQKFLIYFLSGILSIYLAANIFNGVHFAGITGLLGSGIVLTVILLLLRPVILVIALPLNLLTMGLFGLVINAWMIQLTGLVYRGIQVAGFWSALEVAAIMWLLNFILKRLLPNRPRKAASSE